MARYSCYQFTKWQEQFAAPKHQHEDQKFNSPQLGLGTTQVEITIAGTSASTPITIGSSIPASIKVEPQSAEPGEWVTITGTELPPLTTISSFTLGGISVLPPFPIATEASGEFTTGVLMPALPNGVHIVVLTVGSTSTAATFIVTGSP